jgi:hypothetical protein
MHLVTFSNRVELVFSKTAGQISVVIEPGVTFAFSANQLHRVMENSPQIKAAIARQSVLESRVRPFRAELDGKGQSVLFYTGAGGYGDQLMAAPVVRLLSDRGYQMHVLTDPGNNTCWQYDWIKSVSQLPIPAADLARYDHLAFYELVTNIDEHADQLHPTDNLLHRAGVDYGSVPLEKKSVKPAFTLAELAGAQTFVSGRELAIYQLCSSSVVRSLPVESSRKLAVELAQSLPQFHWLATYDGHNKAEYYAPIPDCPKNLELKTFPQLRDFLAVASLAKLVVSVDSLAVHIAGSCGVPCVGLWGAVDPHRRVAYYRNHLAVWQRQACQVAPCFCGNPEAFPLICPPVDGGRKSCSVLDMGAKIVVKAARQLIKRCSS